MDTTGGAILQLGTQVRLRSRPAEVGEIVRQVSVPGSADVWYRVRFGSGTRSVPGNSLMSAELPEDAHEQVARGVWGGVEELRLLLTGLRLGERNLTDQLRSLRAARLLHLPYQYKPLLKLLDSEHQRVLIADEVGLGKTIEAGLIYSELLARHDLQRVLVLAPANLVLKWQLELRDRFDEEFEIRDARWLRENLVQVAEEGRDPGAFRAICSIESARRFAKELEATRPALDLLIVDEAHRMRNERRLTFKMGRALAESADAVVLCSATPIQTSSKDLFNLLRVLHNDLAGTFKDFERDLVANRPVVQALAALVENQPTDVVRDRLNEAREMIGVLRPQDAAVIDRCISRLSSLPPIEPAQRVELLGEVQQLNIFGTAITRTRRRDVFQRVARRKAGDRRVDLNPDERQLYERVTMAAQALARGSRGWTGATFSAIMRQRQAASCLAAFIDDMNSGSGLAADEVEALRADVIDDGDLTDLEPAAPASLRTIARGVHLPTDSKLDEFLALLDELSRGDPGYKVVVFSTFRGTVRYLSRMLRSKGWGHVLLSGEVIDRTERQQRIATFGNDPKCHVLLSTEVGGEGIDLQFCSTLVNYDLPWNPMVIEQRIGRLDRIGQTADVIRIYNLTVENTIESRMLDRLFVRIRLFEESIGPLEAILGERIHKLALDLLRLAPEEQEERLEREAIALEQQKREAARLDAEATNLLGDDAYYQQRLARIEAAQGDIGDDLRIFVSDFLSREFEHAALIPEPASRAGVLRLTFDARCSVWLREISQQAPLALKRFAVRYAAAGTDSLAVTFRQSAAEAMRSVEFLTTTHPFVRAIASRVAARHESKNRAFAIRLPSAVVPPGRYVLALALQEITGIRPRREIATAGLDLTRNAPLTNDTADQLANEVLKGKTREVPAGTADPRVVEATESCETMLAERTERRAREVSEENRMYLERRIASLQTWFNKQISRAEQLSTRHSDARVRRMNAGRASKLRGRLEAELQETRAREKVVGIFQIEAFVDLVVGDA